MVKAAKGVLVQSDPHTIQFILHMDSKLPAGSKAIMSRLSDTALFLKKDRVAFIREQLHLRTLRNTYEPEDEEDDE